MGRHALGDPALPPTRGVRNQRIQVQLIMAVDGHGVLGNEGRLPWHSAVDMANFRNLTAHQPVIVGRVTWQDIVRRAKGPKVLPTRTPIIMTRTPNYYAPDQHVATDRDEALALADKYGTGQVMVIGGASIYQLFQPICSTIHLTRIPGCHTGDTFMNREWLRAFRMAEWSMTGPTEEPLEFMTFHRVGGWPTSSES